MILNVDQLLFRYGRTDVLNDLSFSIREHQLISILGPNGAGKTTLLKCINGILSPHRGTVFIHAQNVMKMSRIEIARKTAYVAQTNQASAITVFDAVLLGRYPHRDWNSSASDHAKVESIIDALRLKHLALRYINELSGGELQKVCIARALVQEPDILLLDEPTSNLDLKNQLDILRLIRRIVDEHDVAAVMTMHDLNSATRYSDKLILMKEGEIHSYCGNHDLTPDIVEAVYETPVSLTKIDGYPVIVPNDP